MSRIVSLALVAALITTACGDDRSFSQSGGSGGAGGDVIGAGGDGGHSSATEPVVSIKIDPATAETVVENGVGKPVTFTVVGTREDGTPVSGVTATWGVDRTEVGTFGAAGVFTPRGELGGVVTIRATVNGVSGPLEATATLTVRLETTVNVGTVAPAVIGAVSAAPAGAAPAPAIVYPQDRVMMPQNVVAPDIQWTPVGAAADVFRVRLSKPHVRVTALVAPGSANPLDHHYLPEPTIWRALSDSDLDSPISLELTRWDSASSTLSAAHTITMQIAPGAISGALYYWQVTGSQVMRILPGKSTREPVTAAGACVACHTVSRDGRYLAGSQTNSLLSTVMDLTTDPPTTVFSKGPPYIKFSAFSPDSKRLLVNRMSDDYEADGTDLRAFSLLDPLTGQDVPSTGLNAIGSVSQPEWSPDGTKVAYIGNVDSSYSRSDVYESGNLSIMPVTGADAFGASSILHLGSALAAAPEGGNADMHPTWSPDSQHLAFAHGEFGRATVGGDVVSQYFPGALYLISASGGLPLRLDNANGGAGGTQSYWPTFSPFTTPTPSKTGRLFWLAFFSPRAYGNHPPAANPPHSQLWVTAIDPDAAAGDPSHVPYWLPAQDPAAHNIDAHWTALPCRTNGEGCGSASECCSGVCLTPNGGGAATCGPPPPAMCRTNGQSCGGSGDCCADLLCVANACVPNIH